MKKKDFRNHKKINDLLIGFSDKQIVYFDQIYEKYINKKENSFSKMFRRCENLAHIIRNNSKDFESLYNEYYSTESQKRKIEIKYGANKLDDYLTKLKSRDKPKTPHSIWDFNFWIKRGFTEEESKNKVKDLQIENTKKRTSKSYENFSEKIKYSVDYWIKQGYSLEEAEILKTPYLQPMKNDLESLVMKHGFDLGFEKWIKRCEKYKETIKNNLSNRRSAGYVSKESLKFFIPLYKFCRKLGLKRKEIYFGIKGSREFFIKDTTLCKNGGKFYDFTIPRLNIVIEYHGTFWHPKNIEEWTNPWIDFYEACEIDNHKKNLATNKGMDYNVVWSSDNLNQKFVEMCDLIKRKYNDT